MQDTSKIKEEIIKFLQNYGPSLPIKISQHIKIDSLFASAFLSELLNEQKVKITNMKVGTSPVYYTQGTEAGIEKYSEHLKSKEKEAFNLLKDNFFLEDETQQPAIRVALRSIPDFAKAFKYNDKIIWRYYLIPSQEYTKQNINKPESMPQSTTQPETKLPKTFISSVQKEFEKNQKEDSEKNIIQEEISIETSNKEENEIKLPKESLKEEKENKFENKNLQKNFTKNSNEQTLTPTFTNPLAKKQTPIEEKPKPEFCEKIISIIKKNNWEIIEELEYKTKEYNALIKINSDLGPIIFKLQAKDKKTFSEEDLSKLLGEAQSIPLPALYMTNGDTKKKTQEFLDKYESIIKYKKIL